jgi:hypothetical protein
MAKRDPEKTARNERIAAMSAELKRRLPRVLELTGIDSESSLHGIYGGKHAQFIDIKNAVIHTPEHFVALWLRGYMQFLRRGHYAKDFGYYKNFELLQRHPEVYDYVEIFLQRTFLRNYDALVRTRPTVEHSEIWIGQIMLPTDCS